MPKLKLESAPGLSATVSTGSTMLDLALGGGWATSRIVNIVGDKSSGKTLLAIEAAANFAILKGKTRYAESEFALEEGYAHNLGLPLETEIPKGEEQITTVEGFHRDLSAYLERCDPATPNLYVLDSLDALSDEAELDRDITEGSYGTGKAKLMSQIFRRVTGEVEKSNTTLFIISQLRDKLNVTFGETKTRSGGRALDFYASQIVWLYETGKYKRTVKGNNRIVGVDVLAKVKKNKIGLPFREAEFRVIFGYGVDDEYSMIQWLKENKIFDAKEAESRLNVIETARVNNDRAALKDISTDLKARCTQRWNEIEDALRPKLRKYQ